MTENGTDAPEQLVKFEPKGRPRTYDTPVEEAGQAIVARIQRAADLANENCDRALRLAHKLSMELRAAGDRINQLEAQVQLFQDRAARAEYWLQTIKAPRSEVSLRHRTKVAPLGQLRVRASPFRKLAEPRSQ
jgi:hypothetical protein